MRTIPKFGGKAVTAFLLFLLTSVLVFSYIATNLNPNSNVDELLSYSSITVSGPNANNNLLDYSAKEKLLPVQIFAKNNFRDYQQRFFLQNDTVIRVHAVGEAADYSSNPFLFRPWDNDGIEFFFSMNNTRSNIFDLNNGDLQFRILWKTLKIDGQNHGSHGLKVNELDPNDHSYTIKILVPWKILGIVSPHENLRFGFDATIIDCDGGSEKAKIDWHNVIDDDWKSVLHYGQIVLKNKKPMPNNADVVIAEKRTTQNSTLHKKYLYEYKNVTVGYVSSPTDLSGKFHAEWNEQGLYLEVFVIDNIKTVANALFDYGWIEDENGKTVWRMTTGKLHNAGGAMKNKFIDTVISLKKGHYVLRYHTDESHSPQQWDDAPPNLNFYGISLSK